MDRKKFVTIFSTSLIGAAIIKANPLNFLMSKKTTNRNIKINVSANPNAVKREKSGIKNG